MDWGFIIGPILIVALIHWESGRKIELRSFLKDVLIFYIIIIFLKLIGHLIHTYIGISLSPFDYLPEVVNLWIGGLLMFGGACYLSYQVWESNSQ